MFFHLQYQFLMKQVGDVKLRRQYLTRLSHDKVEQSAI